MKDLAVAPVGAGVGGAVVGWMMVLVGLLVERVPRVVEVV
jgi:hypothetical protein